MMRSITTFSLLLRTRQIARLTAAISGYAQLRGLGWLVTVAQHLSDYATAEALRSRIEARDDLPLSEGYSAAPHALLTAPELERELRWAFSNPWRGGLRDRFGIERRWLAPPLPDFDRVAATALYAAEA
ncbi:hypothetical protein, partial [Salinispira pacifica]